MYLFFDTETTGLFKENLPPGDPSQPHIVQLGAILTNEAGRTEMEINAIIKPKGWIVPEGAAKVHGIPTERAERYGLKLEGVMQMFLRAVTLSSMVVAHNMKFDSWMAQKEFVDAGLGEHAHIFVKRRKFCTMEGSSGVMKLPATEKMKAAGYGDKFKPPGMQEAHVHFFGKEFAGAHDAMADVRACRDVFFELKRMGVIPNE